MVITHNGIYKVLKFDTIGGPGMDMIVRKANIATKNLS